VSALYDEITVQILNRIEALDEQAFIWKPRFTVMDSDITTTKRYTFEVDAIYPWRTRSRDCDKSRNIIKAMNNPPLIKQGYDYAAYCPIEDTVKIPDRTEFHSEEEFYSTVFHELVHSTGHNSRLDRSLLQIDFNRSADPDPREAEEEVLTELASAFLCGHAGIIDKTIASSVAYIQRWSTVLNPQNTACALLELLPEARRACDYVLNDSASA